MQNFSYFLSRTPSIPIGILLEPVVKQLHQAEGVSYIPNMFDFEFFTTLARHPKLTTRGAILIMDLCGKIYVNNINWASTCQVPFMVCTRYLHEGPVCQFLMKFIDLTVGLLHDLEKDAFKPISEDTATPKEEDQELLPRYDKDVPLKTAVKTLPPLPIH